MIYKLTTISLCAVLLLSACGEEKSTGEKMSEAVAKIRGVKQKIELPKKEISSETEVIEETVHKDENGTPIELSKDETPKEEPQESLSELATKATKDITQELKELAKPAQEATATAIDSAKESISEIKESASSAIDEAKKSLAPAMDIAKEQTEKVKDFLIPATKENQEQSTKPSN